MFTDVFGDEEEITDEETLEILRCYRRRGWS